LFAVNQTHVRISGLPELTGETLCYAYKSDNAHPHLVIHDGSELTVGGRKEPDLADEKKTDPDVRTAEEIEACEDAADRGDPCDDAPVEDKPVEIPETRYDLQILKSLRQIVQATDIHSRKLKSEHNITVPQLVCLITIVDDGPLTATKIAEEVFLSPSTVVGILDRLESRKLIQRDRDLNDRRVIHVSATDKGRAVVDTTPSPLHESLVAGLKNLSWEEQEVIAASLKQIVRMMHADYVNGEPILESDDPK
jgi:DNA-binding MarR family transcriptional regulator